MKKENYQIIITLLSVWGVVVFFLLLYINASYVIKTSNQEEEIIHLRNVTYIKKQKLIDVTNRYESLQVKFVNVVQQRNFLNNEVARYHNRRNDAYVSLE